MATRLIPGTTSTRTIPAPDAGGGGGGGGNPYRDWTEIDIHDSSLWQRQNGPRAAAAAATLTSDGSVLTYNHEVLTNIDIRPGVMLGTMYIAKAHLKPYEECGFAEPSGVGANQFYPEQFSLKVEVLVDTIPITGPTSDVSLNGYGQKMMLGVGLVHYATDQSSAPALPGTNQWVFARLHKHLGTNPDNSEDGTNLYKVGYMSWTAQGNTGGARWKCQPSGGDTRHDALVFQATFGPHSRNSSEHLWTQGGSYSTTNPRARSLMSGNGNQSDSTQFGGSSDRYVHIALAFGTFDNTNCRGQIRVRRVRYALQPIVNREDFTAE